MRSCEGCDVAATNLTCICKWTEHSIDCNNVCFYCSSYKWFFTILSFFKGKHLVRSKIEIDSILEKLKQFNYLGCEMSLYGETDFDKKIKRFQRILELLENI